MEALFRPHSLTIDIAIYEEHILIKKYTIVKNSKKESKFIAELIDSIKRLNTENLTRKEALDQTVQEFGDKVDGIWFKYSKIINITKHSKSW